jgi:hypothetical protein
MIAPVGGVLIALAAFWLTAAPKLLREFGKKIGAAGQPETVYRPSQMPDQAGNTLSWEFGDSGQSLAPDCQPSNDPEASGPPV